MTPGINIEEIAVDFLRLGIAGRTDEMYAKYVDMHGKHHNPWFPAGFPALQQAMAGDFKRSPHKSIEVKHVVADGAFVAVHSHVVTSEGEPGFQTIHIFRFERGKIVELWDCAAAIPKDSPNSDGTF